MKLGTVSGPLEFFARFGAHEHATAKHYGPRIRAMVDADEAAEDEPEAESVVTAYLIEPREPAPPAATTRPVYMEQPTPPAAPAAPAVALQPRTPPGPNAKYVGEYYANKRAFDSVGLSQEDYVATRRIDDGLDSLTPSPAEPQPASEVNPLVSETAFGVGNGAFLDRESVIAVLSQ